MRATAWAGVGLVAAAALNRSPIGESISNALGLSGSDPSSPDASKSWESSQPSAASSAPSASPPWQSPSAGASNAQLLNDLRYDLKADMSDVKDQIREVVTSHKKLQTLQQTQHQTSSERVESSLAQIASKLDRITATHHNASDDDIASLIRKQQQLLETMLVQQQQILQLLQSKSVAESVVPSAEVTASSSPIEPPTTPTRTQSSSDAALVTATPRQPEIDTEQPAIIHHESAATSDEIASSPKAIDEIRALLTQRLHQLSSSGDSEQSTRSIRMLSKYLSNISRHPDDLRYQKFPSTNQVFRSSFSDDSDRQLLQRCGFQFIADGQTCAADVSTSVQWIASPPLNLSDLPSVIDLLNMAANRIVAKEFDSL